MWFFWRITFHLFPTLSGTNTFLWKKKNCQPTSQATVSSARCCAAAPSRYSSQQIRHWPSSCQSRSRCPRHSGTLWFPNSDVRTCDMVRLGYGHVNAVAVSFAASGCGLSAWRSRLFSIKRRLAERLQDTFHRVQDERILPTRRTATSPTEDLEGEF